MATRIRSANFSTDADDYIKLTAEGLGNFAKTNFPTTASGATAAGADAKDVSKMNVVETGIRSLVSISRNMGAAICRK